MTKKKLSLKEKREIGLIVGAILVVGLIGLTTMLLAQSRIEAISGAAIKLNPNLPTNPGVLIMLKDYCGPVTGEGNCDSVCGEKVCIPIEENCNYDPENNQCFCCNNIS